MGFIFYYFIFFFLIYDDSTPTHHPTPRPGSMACRALGSQEGALPTSALPPQALTVGSGSYQGLSLPSPLPLPALWNSPGAPRGPEGKAWLPKGVVAGGLPGKVAPPHPAPLLHLVSPLDQTRNKENVWNLSCRLLFLIPAGQGPRPHGQDTDQPTCLAGENRFLSGAGGKDSAGWPRGPDRHSAWDP